MLRYKLLHSYAWKLQKRTFYETAKRLVRKIETKGDVMKIRNIGILAHIDAGKTTTTERMLYYAGIIENMGEVHHGNTVTDYMEQERQRGITITSAAVTFFWKDYRFNLIDTPGHIDFTMGVEQSVGILDGAVVVLDGSAGVEAQTVTVWRQADRYSIPRLVYVNKMDRPDADFDMCVQSIETKLDTVPFPIQFPIKDNAQLSGIVDVLTLEKLIFHKKGCGKTFQRIKLEETEDTNLLSETKERRKILTDQLSGLDDALANIVIEQNSLDNVPANILMESLRRCTIARKGVPVLLGSSYKNIGVQPLMDSVILYLPFPGLHESHAKYKYFKDNLCCKVFKIVHDKQRGPVAFLRIYNGTLNKGQKLYNIQREITEQCSRLYVAYADEYEEISEIDQGNIAAIAGLKRTIAGDLLTMNASAADCAKKAMLKDKNMAPEEVEKFFVSGANIPDPVFFCSIEPPSISYQSALEEALNQLEKEDPSLRVKHNAETGQTVLAGMGELHMEIIRERIRSEYKIDVDLGELQIAYKETIQNEVKQEYEIKHDINSTIHKVKVIMSVIPNCKTATSSNPVLHIDKSPECIENTSRIHPKALKAVHEGLKVAFINGPKLGCPIINVAAKLHWLEVGKGTSNTIIAASITQCIKKLLKEGDSIILEPIMDLEVVVMEDHATGVVADLNRRRAEIKDIDVRGRNKVIRVFAPLSELLGYATSLRITTSGNATFTMEFSHYQVMGPFEEREAIKKVTGF